MSLLLLSCHFLLSFLVSYTHSPNYILVLLFILLVPFILFLQSPFFPYSSSPIFSCSHLSSPSPLSHNHPLLYLINSSSVAYFFCSFCFKSSSQCPSSFSHLAFNLVCSLIFSSFPRLFTHSFLVRILLLSCFSDLFSFHSSSTACSRPPSTANLLLFLQFFSSSVLPASLLSCCLFLAIRNSVCLACLLVQCTTNQFQIAFVLVTISALHYASHKRPSCVGITCDTWRRTLPLIMCNDRHIKVTATLERCHLNVSTLS